MKRRAMKRPRVADLIWISIPVTAIVHNTWAAVTGREQLSDAMNRYRSAQPLLMEAAILLTAAHLTRSIPPWCDPWAWIHRLIHMNRSVLVGLAGAGGAYVLLSRAEDITIDFGEVTADFGECGE